MKNKLFLVLTILALISTSSISAQEQLSSGFDSPPMQSVISGANLSNKISLDMKGMDIVDVLKILSEQSGMNIVIGKNVTGRVTLFLKDVDLWDAFEIILSANDLAYDKTGNIINVMTQRDYELLYGGRFQDKKIARVIQLKYAKASDLSKALTQIKSNLGRVVVDEGSNTLAILDSSDRIQEMEDFIKKTDLPLETRVFNLNYAQADKLSAKLQEVITKNIGSLRIDERTNKIVVTDYPKNLNNIAKIISAFDEKTTQVLIDAQIIEITPSDTFKMGVDWDAWIKSNLRLMESLPTAGGTNVIKVAQAAKGLAVSQVGQYKLVIDMLRTIGDTKILSSPRIMALNNQEAKILVGTKEAYVTQTTSQGGSGTEVTADAVNFVDVGIKLYVTPTINRDGFVTMKIRPEISSSQYRNLGTDASPKNVPIVTTSESETTVMVKDGITLIIGGLKKDQRDKTVTKVPGLGDIPLLGFLFRNTSDAVTKSELVILLTPHIMNGETSFTEFSEIKPNEGAIAKMIKGNIIMEDVSASKEAETIDSLNKQISNNYYKLIIDKAKNFAKLSAPKGKKGEVELSFKLTQNGKLIDEPKIVNSTDIFLNVYAVNAIKDASPFELFPKELKKTEESFNITLEYK